MFSHWQFRTSEFRFRRQQPIILNIAPVIQPQPLKCLGLGFRHADFDNNGGLMGKELIDMTTDELKVLGYDLIHSLEMANLQLKRVNEIISAREKDASSRPVGQ